MLLNRKNITDLARDLRKNQTRSEAILWEILRNRRLSGKKITRQHPIIYDSYMNKSAFKIADFFCAEYKLIIEVDGKIHEYQKEHDQQRDYLVEKMDYKVIRILNEELTDLEKVKKKILENLT